MKKFIVSAICAAVALCSISFSACSGETADSNSGLINQNETANNTENVATEETSTNNGLINLADCEVGDELPVYPDCSFSYQLSDGTIFHINEIKVTLSAKNEINEGDVLTSTYYPYTLTLNASASVEPSETLLENLNNENDDEEIYIAEFRFLITFMPENTTYYTDAEMNDDYTIKWNRTMNLHSVSTIYFSRITTA